MSARRFIGTLLLIAALLALGGCGQSAAPARVHVAGDPRAGLSAFKFEGCGACHAIAQVSVGTAGPALNGEGARRSPSWLASWLPSHLRSTNSPALPARDRQDLVSYLANLR